MSIDDNKDKNAVIGRDLALQAVVGQNPYILLEIETPEGSEESIVRISTVLNKEQVGDVLFGVLSQLNE